MPMPTAIPSTAATSGFSTVASVFRKRMALSPIAPSSAKRLQLVDVVAGGEDAGHAGDQEDSGRAKCLSPKASASAAASYICAGERVVLLRPVEAERLDAVRRSRPRRGRSCSSLLNSPQSRNLPASSALANGVARMRGRRLAKRRRASGDRRGKRCASRRLIVSAKKRATRPIRPARSSACGTEARPWREARRRRQARRAGDRASRRRARRPSGPRREPRPGNSVARARLFDRRRRGARPCARNRRGSSRGRMRRDRRELVDQAAHRARRRRA